MTTIPPTLFAFLNDLKANNNRNWFRANKDRYDSCVKEPLLEFIRDFDIPLASIASHYRAIPKVGGSLFRIYRDIRFSKDKRPYKTAAGVHFRHEAGKTAHAPGFYLHLEPGDVFTAVGIWGADVPTLTMIRQAIVTNDLEWEHLIQDREFRGTFRRMLEGNELKRPPRGFNPNHRFVNDLKRRHFVAIADLSEEAVCAPDFASRLIEDYRRGVHFMKFMTTAVGLPW